MIRKYNTLNEQERSIVSDIIMQYKPTEMSLTDYIPRKMLEDISRKMFNEHEVDVSSLRITRIIKGTLKIESEYNDNIRNNIWNLYYGSGNDRMGLRKTAEEIERIHNKKISHTMVGKIIIKMGGTLRVEDYRTKGRKYV